MRRWDRLKLWVARKLLGTTGYVAVPLADVQTLDSLCTELLTYASISGALNDPRRLKARKRIGQYSSLMCDSVDNLLREVDA